MSGQDQQFQEFVQEVAGAVAPVLQQQQQTAVPPGTTQQPAATPQPIQLSVDGQQYQFASQAELEQTLPNTFQQVRSKINDLEGAAPTQEQPQQTFDNKLFMEKMGTDPVAAMDYMDSFRKTEKDAEIENLQQRVQQQDYTMAAYQFKEQHPEFAANPQGHNVLRGIMQQNGWDLTYGNLEAALAIGQMRGMFPSRAQYDQYLQQQQEAAQRGPVAQVPDLSQFQQPQPSLQQQQYTAQPQPQPQAQLQPAFQPQPQQQPWATQQVPGAIGGNPLQAQFEQAGASVAQPPPQVAGSPAAGVVPPSFLHQADQMTADQLEAAIHAMASGAPQQV
jgi:hypothetical protein